jgi:hypothetical protein
VGGNAQFVDCLAAFRQHVEGAHSQRLAAGQLAYALVVSTPSRHAVGIVEQLLVARNHHRLRIEGWRLFLGLISAMHALPESLTALYRSAIPVVSWISPTVPSVSSAHSRKHSEKRHLASAPDDDSNLIGTAVL